MDKKGGHFFNGFFWGAVIGGGLAYLLSTKRGRDVLKELIEDGIDMLDNATTPKEAEIISEPVLKTDPPESRKEVPTKRFFKKATKN